MIFALGESEHASSPARIDGIDRAFLFGNARHPVLALGCTPSTMRSGVTQVSWGLPQVGTNYSTIYLGFDTTLVSSGASPVTLAPGDGGVNPPIARPTGEYYSRYSRYLF